MPESSLPERPSGHEVWLRADPGDGNDHIEATTRLAIIPRKGDLIEVWRADAGMRDSFGLTGTQVWLKVKDVVLYTDGATVEVWVSMDTYDLDELRGAFEAIKRGDDPGKRWKEAACA